MKNEIEKTLKIKQEYELETSAFKNKKQKIMNKTKENKNITLLDELLDEKYGNKGTEKGGKWGWNFESFQLEVLLEQARIELGMTQEQFTEKKWVQTNPIFPELETRRVISVFQL